MRPHQAAGVAALLISLTGASAAFEADGCETQRAQYPRDWNATAGEKTLYVCSSNRGDPFKVKLGPRERPGARS